MILNSIRLASPDICARARNYMEVCTFPSMLESVGLQVTSKVPLGYMLKSVVLLL